MLTIFKWLAMAGVFALALPALAAEPYFGTFLFKYAGGTTYRVTVKDGTHLHWECVEGAAKGSSGDETVTRFKVAENIYFVTWVEKTGIVVSEVVDLGSMKVYATIVEGRERYVLEGDIVRVQPPGAAPGT
ncbi:MAG TPA: phenolic acid decarboxylase [Candidatus Aminicenantes bacterium]|nr:phenolic acid decarboxylase [Candidatus Aminicenantes bacterium]